MKHDNQDRGWFSNFIQIVPSPKYFCNLIARFLYTRFDQELTQLKFYMFLILKPKIKIKKCEELINLYNRNDV